MPRPPRDECDRFPCQECGKSFYDVSGLRRHSKSHTGIKAFGCWDCDEYATERKDCLRSHCLNRHGIEAEQFEAAFKSRYAHLQGSRGRKKKEKKPEGEEEAAAAAAAQEKEVVTPTKQLEPEFKPKRKPDPNILEIKRVKKSPRKF